MIEEHQLSVKWSQLIPSEIEKFTPNTKWTVDMMEKLPKKRYGVEIKITPENARREIDQPPAYHHPRIFKSIVTAILTAAPGISICSIDDDEEMIIDLEDIPTFQSTIDHYLESPTVNQKHIHITPIYI
jgi:hypothetical protein